MVQISHSSPRECRKQSTTPYRRFPPCTIFPIQIWEKYSAAMHYTMACPLVQQVFEHAFRDCRSFQKDGAEGEGSKAVCLEPCLGRQEPLHQLTERGTPSLFSDNFNLTTMIQKLDGSMETKPTLWVSLQNQKFLSVVHSQEDLISA